MAETASESVFEGERRTLTDRIRQFDVAAIRERYRRNDADRPSSTRWEQITMGPLPPAGNTHQVDERDISIVTALATHLMAKHIADHTNGDRRSKMQKVVERQAEGIDQLFADGGMPDVQPEGLLLYLVGTWPEADRLRLLIDLDFTDPFFPFDLKVGSDQFDRALRWISRHVGMGETHIDSIAETRRDAERAHNKNRIVRIVAFGAGGLVLLGAGGWALAPVIGTALGTGAGLSGAAATAHGLALLGGGSLAAGGSGMAGGMFLVTGAGAAVGAVGGGGSAFLLGVGAVQARLEVVRLQVTYRMTILDQQISSVKATSVVQKLQTELDVLEKTLLEERELNEENSRRLDDLESKIASTKTAVRWMEDQASERTS